MDDFGTSKESSSAYDIPTELGLEGNIEIPESVKKMSLSLSNAGVRDWIFRRRETVRPWGEFLSSARFSKPSSVANASQRVVANIEHFQSNYIFVFVGLLLYCLITSPLLLIALAGVFGAFYFVSVKNSGQKLNIAGYELTLFQQYVAIAACSLPIFFFIGAGSAFFWVIGASFVAIMLHAVFFNTQIDGVDDAETELMMDEVTVG
ncbi:prenylated Rab acceptor protein 1-like [Apostichopus japonicus]|uniref:prenylated Rab acceptor protein 1-like n=1 Tax=Stichopus japonicus TaxID=307972 RepID=UPI003AB20B76